MSEEAAGDKPQIISSDEIVNSSSSDQEKFAVLFKHIQDGCITNKAVVDTILHLVSEFNLFRSFYFIYLQN